MSLQAVFENMEKLIEAHQTLLDLGERKKQALIVNDIDQLTAAVNKEGRLIKQVTELDQQRIHAIGAFMLEKGYRPNPYVTISDLTKLIFKMDEKKALQTLQQTLLQTIERLKTLNELNRQLLEQSLTFVNYSLDLVLGPPEDEAVYQNPQQQQGYGFKRQGMFDSRA
ncbi:flagellar protein FlgN [Paenibacillus thalictri]|uniref:Flagellar protein FlgN n=1 Tax=Paenibacillus thalictri TaxID=2527873 RepID=A0A4Q9DJB3_9BACL|nr:flagellar protein FlgN [Paenibacillus thalictri]TBL72991.1 flagellar protein FlgN [Paenibacillus thalictri]